MFSQRSRRLPGTGFYDQSFSSCGYLKQYIGIDAPRLFTRVEIVLGDHSSWIIVIGGCALSRWMRRCGSVGLRLVKYRVPFLSIPEVLSMTDLVYVLDASEFCWTREALNGMIFVMELPHLGR